METLQTIFLVLQVLVAISLIGLILIQHGKGADAGAAFGSGSSNTVFGSQGSGNFLTKTTAILAFVFLANSLGLAYISNQRIQSSNTSLMDDATVIIEQAAEPTSSVINQIPIDPDSEISEIPDLPQQ
jgi:preprotein translocase subunit SecG